MKQSGKKIGWKVWLITSVFCAAVRQLPPVSESVFREEIRALAVQKGIYQIECFEDLRELSRAVLMCEGSFEAEVWLMDDIQSDGEAFMPIGDALHRFEGVFDGCGHTISGLTAGGSDPFQGLFGYVGNRGIVKNVTLKNAHISGMRYTAGIAAYSSGSIENCRVEQSQIIGQSRLSYANVTGGIAALSDGTIDGCVIYQTSVTGERCVGGIVGSQHRKQISRCICIGEISSRHAGQCMTGGIVGSAQTGAQVTGCISLCTVRSFGQWTGGIAGSVQSGRLLGCIAMGEIEGSNAGGISGYAAPQAQMMRCAYIGSLPVGVGQGSQSGTEVFRADGQQLERNRRWLSVLLEERINRLPITAS